MIYIKNSQCINCVRIGGYTCPYCIDALREKHKIRNDCNKHMTLEEFVKGNVQLSIFDL